MKLKLILSSLLFVCALVTASAQAVTIPTTSKWDPGTVQKVNGNFTKAFGTTVSATLDFPSTTAANVSHLRIYAPGALVGDAVILHVPATAVTHTATYMAWISAADSVKIKFSSKATENPASASFKATVIRR